jgi:hypothetical protein
VSHRTEHIMDELPELHSDADVDALMARLRAKVTPPQTVHAPAEPSTSAATPDDPVRDLVAAQDTFAATVVRAMQVMAEAFEDLESAAPTASPVRARRRGAHRIPADARRVVRRRAR